MHAFSFLVCIVIWQLVAWGVHAPLILPEPLTVCFRLVALCRTAVFWQHVAATAVRVVQACALTVSVGTLLGMFSGLFHRFASFIAFPLAVIRSVPVVSFILLALFWLGTDAVPVFCAVLMALPAMTTAVATGIRALDKKLLAMADVYQFTRMQRIRYIYGDGVRDFFIAGVRTAFGMIWKVVAAGEVLSVPRRALGSVMQQAQVHLETADVLAVSLMIVLLSVAADAVLFRFCAALGRKCRQRVPSCENSHELSAAVSWETPQPLFLSDVSIARGSRLLYEHFSVQLPAGAVSVFVAPSGAGKTTLLDFIAETYRVSYLFQEPRLLPRQTLLQNVALPLFRSVGKPQAYARAACLLKEVGLGERLNDFPEVLSGGERQRVALCRAFAFPSGILLLDEPFQSQDVRTKQSLLRVLETLLAAAPRTVLLVTHDVREAIALGTQIFVLRGEPLSIVLSERVSSVARPSERFVQGNTALEQNILHALLV